jgi:hypothetical protein
MLLNIGGVRNGQAALWEEHGLRVSENRGPKRIFGSVFIWVPSRAGIAQSV